MKNFFNALGVQSYQACHISRISAQPQHEPFLLRGILQVHNNSYYDRQGEHHEKIFFYCQKALPVKRQQDLILITPDFGLLKLVPVYSYADNTAYPAALRHNCYKAIPCSHLSIRC